MSPSASASEQARDEATAIVLLAKARVGELTRELSDDKGPLGRPKKGVPGRNTLSRTDKLEGLSRKDAAECEKIADLKQSGDLDRMIARPGGAVTTAG